MALFAIIGPARTWGKRPLIMPDFVAGPIEFQQLSVVRTAFARPRMDLRTEERAGASGPVQAIRSKRFFEGAQTGRRARPFPCLPPAPLLKGSLLCCSSRVRVRD